MALRGQGLAAVWLVTLWLGLPACGRAEQEPQAQRDSRERVEDRPAQLDPVRPPAQAEGAQESERPEDPQAPVQGDAQALLDYERNTTQIVREHGPSVVAIDVQVRGRRVGPFEPQDVPGGLPELFEELIPRLPLPPRRGSGSGFVIDADGHILTNYHVVAEALEQGTTELAQGASIEVVFAGLEQGVPARVLGASALYDLALLELGGEQPLPDAVRRLAPIELADSDRLLVGQKAIAIGNPFGFASSVTTGIVSGIGRLLPGVGQVEIPLVQTDAAINPGNSGGPLLDSSGRLIGVNTAIVPGMGRGGTNGFLGLGFALPSNLVRENLPVLRKGGLSDIATRARIGVAIVELASYPDEVRESLGLPESGVAIMRVQPGGPAEKAGLRGPRFQVVVEGQLLPAGMDVITAVEGEPIENASELQQRILARDAGESISLDVWREGKNRQLSLVLEVIEPPATPEQRAEPD